MSDQAEAQALAGAMVSLNFDPELMTDWLKAMDSDRYKFGCGLLRDENDRFDPLGVLADLNEVEWTFDDEEGAWSAGDVAKLSLHQMHEFLGLDDRVTAEQIRRFERSLITLTDRSTKFSQITKVLRLAVMISKKTRGIAEQIQSTGRAERVEMRFIGDGAPNLHNRPLWRY